MHRIFISTHHCNRYFVWDEYSQCASIWCIFEKTNIPSDERGFNTKNYYRKIILFYKLAIAISCMPISTITAPNYSQINIEKLEDK